MMMSTDRKWTYTSEMPYNLYTYIKIFVFNGTILLWHNRCNDNLAFGLAALNERMSPTDLRNREHGDI